MRVPDAHLVVGGEQALLLDAGQREGRDVLEALRLLPDIRHIRPAAHGLDAVVKLHVGDGVDAADVVVHLDFELAAEAVALVRKIDELHAVAGRGRDVLVAVALEGAVLAGDHDLEQVVALGIDLDFARAAVVLMQEPVLVEGQGREVQQLAGAVLLALEDEMQAVFIDVNQVHKNPFLSPKGKKLSVQF